MLLHHPPALSVAQGGIQWPQGMLAESGPAAQRVVVRWRGDGPGGPSKRVQDKVVQDPKQIAAAEVRIVFPDGGHEIKSPTEAFKDAARCALTTIPPQAFAFGSAAMFAS